MMPLSFWCVCLFVFLSNGATKECVTDLSSLGMWTCVFFLQSSSPARVWQPAITQTDEDRLIEFKINSFFFSNFTEVSLQNS